MKALLLALLFASSVAAQAEDRTMGVLNNSAEVITELYGSNVYTQQWEEDILRGSYIFPGEVQYIDFYDGTRACRFDFKIVTLSGKTLIRNNVNVCESSYWVLN